MTNIPNLISYDINNTSKKIENIVDWQIDPSRCVLLIHDMQKYFLRYLSEDTKKDLVNNCHSLLSQVRRNNIPVIYTAQCGDMTLSQRGLLNDFWGKGMSRDSSNIDIISPLESNENDFISHKWRYSAFVKSNLLDKFQEMKREQIIICGVYAHIGILATALDAYSNDIQTFVVNNAIAGFSGENHSMAINYMSSCCAKILNVEDILL